MDWAAFRLSLELAALTTAVLLVVGLPLAQWLTRAEGRFAFLVESLVTMPLVLPPTVLGFYLLLALGPASPLGRAFEATFDRQLVFSFEGLLVASVLYGLPFAVRPFKAALAGVDRSLVETSWCLGVSRTQTFVRVVLPLAMPGIVAGAVLTFAHALGEFGVVLMIGGNLEGRTRTLSVAVFDHVGALEYAAAHRCAAALLALAFLITGLVAFLEKRGKSP